MKYTQSVFFSVVVVILLQSPLLADEGANPVVTVRSVSHELAMKIVATAIEDCTKKGYKVTASMVGRDGNLLALLRNPLAGPHTVDVSIRKAYTAASFQTTTANLAKENPMVAHAKGILPVIGGLPLNVGGHIYGGVGVSGAPPEHDEKCAQTSVDMATEILEFAD